MMPATTTSTPPKTAQVAAASQAPPPTATTARPATPTRTRDETIRTTANHPWLTADRGWAQAGSLTLGERVVRADGEVNAELDRPLPPHLSLAALPLRK
ncbi:MAG: hypothetical protein IVW57_06355 [Ktedonobacterales bacterium]|nr:hypothetical protein [Ktedonobacterales bacterium]